VTKRHGARARHKAGACHGALAHRAKSARDDQVLASAFRARLRARRQLSPFISRMLTWWASLSGSAPVNRSVPKVPVHSSIGRLLVISVAPRY